MSLAPWLKIFRVVNLPTVPGDVLAGVASLTFVAAFGPNVMNLVGWACGLSVLIYMFGLIDNDIVGAKTDVGRPIPDGEISLKSANAVRFALPPLTYGLAVCARLPWEWCVPATLLMIAIMVYNRTKSAFLMGCCRGLNVGCGFAVGYFAADAVAYQWHLVWPFVVAVLFTLYIFAVTKYSEGEEMDKRKKRRVGMLIRGHLYLQLATLTAFAMLDRTVIPLLIVGCAMLIALRFFKRMFPGVSAS